MIVARQSFIQFDMLYKLVIILRCLKIIDQGTRF